MPAVKKETKTAGTYVPDPPISATRMTITYVGACMVVILLFLASYFLPDKIISEQHETARITHIAEQQRMLSQRIALLSTDLYAGDTSTNEALQDAVILMASLQDALSGSTATPESQPTTSEQVQYFGSRTPLNAEVRSFLDDARRFIAATTMNAGNDAYSALQHHSRDLLLPALDRAITSFSAAADTRIESARKTQQFVLVGLLLILVLEALLIFRPMIKKIRRYTTHPYEMATRDGLTGLANQRHFSEYANREFRLSRRTGKPLSMAICEIDLLDQLYAKHGRSVGDAVLRRFGTLALQILRDTDIISRVGVDKFALALPVINLHEAMIIADKLRRGIANDRSDNLPPFTVSVGIAVTEQGDKNVDVLLQRAERAMETAKTEGRNRISCLNAAGEPEKVYI
jgi:diguanylate cyclase (GGDEF)-like protein